MAKVLVTYFSQSGNTKKVAESIFEAIDEDKDIFPVQDVTDTGEYSLLFIGFPVHAHNVPYKIEAFLKDIPEGKKIAFFSTHGSLTGSRLSREAFEHAAILTPKAKILGTFSCRGKVSPLGLESLMQSPEHRAWIEMSASAHSHPDENDLEEAKSFAQWILTIYRQS